MNTLVVSADRKSYLLQLAFTREEILQGALSKSLESVLRLKSIEAEGEFVSQVAFILARDMVGHERDCHTTIQTQASNGDDKRRADRLRGSETEEETGDSLSCTYEAQLRQV